MPRNLKTKVTSVCMTLMMMTSVIYPVFADYECEHCYSGETTATCRTAGYTTYTCTLCKDTCTEPAAPVDHEYTVWESCVLLLAHR